MHPQPLARTVALLALVLSIPVAHAEWRDIPYEKVASMPLALTQLDPQHVYTVQWKAKPAKGQPTVPADFQLQVKVGGRVVPVAIGPGGVVDLPIRKDWVDAGAVLQSNQPKGVVAIEMLLESRVPGGTHMSYAQLTESAPILERGIHEMAGLMSFMAPGVKALTLTFAKPLETVVLTLPNGQKKSWRSDSKGQVELPWEPKWAAGMVELSAPLADIDQIVK